MLDGVQWRGNKSFQAKCPIHDDAKASLTVSLADDGKIVLYCHACGKERTKDIISAIGLTFADLTPKQDVTKKFDYQNVIATYYYDNNTRKLRDKHKNFTWQHKESNGYWKSGRNNAPHILYHAGDQQGKVCICEGEKDADNLSKLGFCCVSSENGAGATGKKWFEEYTTELTGKDCVLFPDNDTIGQEFMQFVAAQISGKVKSIKVLNLLDAWQALPEKGDVSDIIDHFGATETLNIINQLEQSTDYWKKPVLQKPLRKEDAAKKFGSGLDPYDDLQDLFLMLRPDDKERYSRDDKGMARLFSEVFQDQLLFNVTAKEWFFFNGKIWKADTGGMFAAKCAKAFSEALVIYGFQLPDGAEKKDFLKFISKYGDYSRRKILVEDARSEIHISNEDLDQDGNLYNLQNGVLNLETFELIPHSPKYLLSKISNVVYDPDARSALFEKTLSEVLEADSEKIYYLMKWLGLTLTEDTSNEEMLILLGVLTRNGKSTVLETIAHMHGGAEGYALNMPPETLAQRKNKDSRTASGDIARLDGCRMLITSEPPKRMLFDAALLKTLLGRDTITARQLYEREFQFVPKFKLFMNTNYLPLIQDDSLFTSGRIKVLEFNHHFTPQEQDRTLKTRLRSAENISGIFNLCLTGLKMYREEGLEPPKTVIQAVESYRVSNDKIQNFINECMERTGKNSGAGSAYKVYREWCLDNGYGVDSKRSFFDELKNKGLFSPLGTVDGKSIKNVIVGHELIKDE